MEATKPRRSGSIVWESQAPLRDLYAEHPDQAMTLKRAVARGVDGDPFHTAVEPNPDTYEVAWGTCVDRKIGGPHDAPNPPEMLCAAVAACEHATIRMVADLLEVEIEKLEVEVKGEVDVRGTLGIDEAAPVGFVSMSCTVDLDLAPQTSRRRRDLLVQHSERSCVTLATLREGVRIDLAMNVS